MRYNTFYNWTEDMWEESKTEPNKLTKRKKYGKIWYKETEEIAKYPKWEKE